MIESSIGTRRLSEFHSNNYNCCHFFDLIRSCVTSNHVPKNSLFFYLKICFVVFLGQTDGFTSNYLYYASTKRTGLSGLSAKM